MGIDDRTGQEKLLDSIEGKVQRLFIHLVDKSDKSDASLCRLQVWEERFQAKTAEIRKGILRRRCEKEGHKFFVMRYEDADKTCLRCKLFVPYVPDGCLRVTDDEVLSRGHDN